jgi:hypothetical protein
MNDGRGCFATCKVHNFLFVFGGITQIEFKEDPIAHPDQEVTDKCEKYDTHLNRWI